jgi:hypothetical protein
VSDSGDVGAGHAPGADDVGSVAEEAARLLGAFSGWARNHGADLGQGVSDFASQASAAVENASSHFATGGPDCTYCPICRVVHVVRECSPEVRTHLALAAANLVQAAAAVLATTVPEEKRRSENVEKIDLDGDWPDEEE